MKPETKARILAPYVGGVLNSLGEELIVFDIDEIYEGLTYCLPIQLKSIDNITNKELELIGCNDVYNLYILSHLETLRQLGYATPHSVIEDGKVKHYSVQDLVNEGLFKII